MYPKKKEPNLFVQLFLAHTYLPFSIHTEEELLSSFVTTVFSTRVSGLSPL